MLKSNKHPEPLDEIEFWQTKANDLNNIQRQLDSQEIKMILKYLEINQSTFVYQFTKIFEEIFIARKEANENLIYLKAL